MVRHTDTGSGPIKHMQGCKLSCNDYIIVPMVQIQDIQRAYFRFYTRVLRFSQDERNTKDS